LVALSFRWNRPKTWRPVVEALVVFVLVALPIVDFVLINQLGLPSLRTAAFSIPRLTVARYQTQSTFFSDDPLHSIRANVHDLWHLLISGDDGQIWNAIPGFGYLYFFGFGLSVLGVIVTLGRRAWWRSEVHFVFMAWLAAALVLSVFALSGLDINRVNILFIPSIYFAAVAVRELAVSRAVLVGVAAFFCLLFAQFAHSYFGSYRAAAAPAFNAQLGDAINEVSRATTGPVCITAHANVPYIYVLFYKEAIPTSSFVRSDM
jgi:hypothetical protein